MGKLCSTCKNVKPVSEFHHSSYSKDGYKPKCKQCKREDQDRRVLARGGKIRISNRISLKEGEKYCTKCELVLNTGLFGANSSWCYPCKIQEGKKKRRAAGVTEKRIRNPQLHELGLRECFICNQILSVEDFLKATRGAHGLRPYCTDCDRKKDREYARDHRESVNTYLRDTYRKTEAYLRYHRHETHLRRAINKNSDVDAAYLKYLYGQSECFYCGNTVEKEKRTADHVIPLSAEGPHIKNNLVMSCDRCNFVKGCRPLEYLLGKLPENRREEVKIKVRLLGLD